jgi:hypothetical protein
MIRIETIAQPNSDILNEGEAELKIELYWNGELEPDDLETAKKTIRGFIRALEAKRK